MASTNRDFGGSHSLFQAGFQDFQDSFKRDEIPAMREDAQDAINMSVPERIVLSAGYDGDENAGEAKRVTSDIFSEQAIPPPDAVMVGMRTPPSTLTVDDSSTFYPRQAAGARTSDGDGSDRTRSPYRMNLQNREGHMSDEDSSNDEISDRAVVIGNENGQLPVMVSRGDAFTRLQRRVTYFERAFEEYQARSTLWTYALLALSIINPIIVSFFLSRRK